MEIKESIYHAFVNPVDLIPIIDLTSLQNNDDETSINSLCNKAITPYGNVASVCVYPKFVKLAVGILNQSSVKIGTVVNFPTGDFALNETLALAENTISQGVNEIDVVFPYKTYLRGDQKSAIQYIKEIKNICKNKTTLKVIIETGEIKSTEVIQMICTDVIDAGADFIKTSTGKTTQGATLEAVEIILNTLHKTVNHHVGLKISGGIRTISQAFSYINIAKKIMGQEWIQPKSFRIGASVLLDEILSHESR